MTLIIDASVAIAWIAADEMNAYADGALNACGSDPAIVPQLGYWEIANTLLVFERKGRLRNAVSAYADLLEQIPLVSDGASNRKNGGVEEMMLARKHRLSVYDTSYLATAMRSGVPLAKLDTLLMEAAIAEGVYFAV